MSDVLFYSRNHEIEIFEKCFNLSIPLLLKGPTGCGKSQLVEYMARRLNRPLVKVACNEDTNAADLLGRFLLKGGETYWQDGPVVRALRENAILYLDEFAEAREDVIVALHPLTDHRREIYLDKINQTLTASSKFMFVASYNPGYQKGLREIKPSTKQRFVVLGMNYLSQEQEQDLLIKLTGVDAKSAKGLALLAHKIRSQDQFLLKETVSTRLLVHAAKLIQSGMNPRMSCHLAIADVLTDDATVSIALKDFIDLHI